MPQQVKERNLPPRCQAYLYLTLQPVIHQSGNSDPQYGINVTYRVRKVKESRRALFSPVWGMIIGRNVLGSLHLEEKETTFLPGSGRVKRDIERSERRLEDGNANHTRASLQSSATHEKTKNEA